MAVTQVLKRGLGATVKLAAEGADLVHAPPVGLTVLVYHRIGAGTTSQVDLPADRFDEQVAELQSSGRLVSLPDGLARLERGEVADGPVALTFDDGTVDWVDVALPVLARHRAPATFYVATDFVDRQVAFPWTAPPISWTGLQELVSTGLATIGSHTHTHALLDRLDGPATAEELDRSIDLIQDRLGAACEHFAYPKALLGSPAAEAEVRQRFASAAIGGAKANAVGTDVHRLNRSPIQVSDGMHWFRRKAAGGMRLEESARRVLNRGRYAGATT